MESRGKVFRSQDKIQESNCMTDHPRMCLPEEADLQVADAMGDCYAPSWAGQLAEKLIDMAWGSDKLPPTTLCTLLRIPPHLLSGVFECIWERKDPQEHGLEPVLRRFPPSLHAALLSAAVVFEEFKLTASDRSASYIFTKLPAVSVPAPGLQRIYLHTTDSCRSHMHMHEVTAALLAQSAAAHTSLTELCFGHHPMLMVSPRWLRTFTACLHPGSLPSLVELDISVHAHPGGAVELARCLSRVPALTSLTASFANASRAASEEVSLSSYAPLVAAPTTLPNLEVLDINECEELRGESSCAHSLLSFLRGPQLTQLCLTFGPCEADFDDLVREVALSHFPSVHSLSYSPVLGQFRAHPQMYHSDAQLPPLCELSITGPCPVSNLSVGTTVCACESVTSSLERLAIVMSHETYMKCLHPRCSREDLPSFWQSLCGVMGSCTGLESLQLHCLGWVAEEHRDTVSVALHGALVQLTQLTALSLQRITVQQARDGFGMPLNGSTIGSALSALTGLRVLRIRCDDGEIRFDSVQPVFDACAQLQRVREMELVFEGVTVPLLSELIPKMHALKLVRLSERIRTTEGEMFSAMCARFPTVEILTSKFIYAFL